MKKILLLLILSGLSLILKAQTTQIRISDTSKKEYTTVETEPVFPGGISKFYEYISKNARYSGNEKGRLLITFVVEKDGSLTDVKVAKGLSEKADKEAVRLISGSPKWIAGTQNNKPVRVRYTVPINFN